MQGKASMSGKVSVSLSITKRQYNLLEHKSRQGKTSQKEAKRMKIILKGSEGKSNYSMSKELDYGVGTIAKWRNRWEGNYQKLQIYEQGASGEGVSDKSLLDYMLEILKDNFRPGCPSTFSDLQKKQIITMACKKPSEYNIPRTKWTHELLAAIAIEEKIVKSISSRHIGDILKKGGGSST